MKRIYLWKLAVLFVTSGIVIVSAVMLNTTLMWAQGSDPPELTPPGNCAARPAVSPTPAFGGFSDVNAHIRYCAPISWAYWNGVISGYSDDTFRPNNGVTRGQFSKMIVNAFAYATPTPATATFADVPPDSTFFKWVEAAEREGLVTGRWGISGQPAYCIGNGVQENPSLRYFTPCLPISRAQMSKPLAQAAGYSDSIPSSRATFSDVGSSNAFYTYIERLAMHIATEDWPPTSSNPYCSASGGRPCYFPGENVLRSDAATHIYLALAYSSRAAVAGRAFARLRYEGGVPAINGLDAVRAYAKAPHATLTPNSWVAMPVAIGPATNNHFIESGPQTLCDALGSCESHPYGSWSTDRYETPVPGGGWNTTYNLTGGNSYRFQSYYAGYFNNKYEWWSEYYDTVDGWVRVGSTATRNEDMGIDSLVEVHGAVETRPFTQDSETLRITLAQFHLPGTPSNQWVGWCPGVGIFQRKMFNSYIGPCSSSGSDPYSWDVYYRH